MAQWRTQLAVGLGVLVCGAICVFLLRPAPHLSGANLAPSQGLSPSSRLWYEQRLSSWRKLDFVDIQDREAVEAAVRSAIKHRLPSDAHVDESKLVRDLTALIWSVGASSPAEFADRIPHRLPMRSAEIANSQLLHGVFLGLTGKHVPADVEWGELWLELRALQGAVPTPTGVSRQMDIEIQSCRPLPPQEHQRKALLINLVLPRFPGLDEFSKHQVLFDNPFAVGFGEVTRPAEELQVLCSRVQRPLACAVQVAFRTADELIVPVRFDLILDETNARWIPFHPWHACIYPVGWVF